MDPDCLSSVTLLLTQNVEHVQLFGSIAYSLGLFCPIHYPTSYNIITKTLGISIHAIQNFSFKLVHLVKLMIWQAYAKKVLIRLSSSRTNYA